jgi:hypothetical protein
LSHAAVKAVRRPRRDKESAMKTLPRDSARPAPRLPARQWLAFVVLAVAAGFAAVRPATAQDELATAEELQALVGPIALYPDDLVAIVLPASTYPLQVVQAARFLEDREDDATLQPNEDWDDSVVALLNYPEVLQLLNDDLDWTYDLGTAVLNQRADVLSAIQDFRDEAYAAGNLRSDERQTVAREDDTIEIKPADPKVIYIPYYEPERVVVYQPAPVYYYYPRPYPVYYYPYPSHYHFSSGFFWGVNTWFSIGWHSHHVHVYDPFYHRHPYYGWNYYNPFYVRNVYVNVNHYHRYPNYVWEPRNDYGGRPLVRGSEGRVYPADRAPRHGVLDSNAAAARTREGPAQRTTATSTSARAQNGVAQPRRGVPSSSYRSRSPENAGAQAAPGAANDSATARSQSGTPQPRRGVPSASYRNRAADGAQQQAAGAAQANTAARTPPGRVAPAQARQPDGAADGTRASTYRGGGGMSQAQGRSRSMAQPGAGARTSAGTVRANPDVSAARTSPAVSPRASERSTGMPREASRAAPTPRASAAAPEPSHGGGAGAQRAESGGGSYRGNSGGGGGARSAHPAARHVR